MARKKIDIGIPQCPLGAHNLSEHSFVDLGSAILESPEESALNAAAREGRWADATRFQAANALVDIRVWRIFLCGDQVVLIPLIATIEPWENDHYGEPIVISDPHVIEALLSEARRRSS
jgi:hypothetical protein